MQTAVDESVPTWSRDGRWIYFSSTRSGANAIWKMPSAGGTAVLVTAHGGFFGQESPDGRFLYFTKHWDYLGPSSMNEIWRMPVEGGDETLVVPGIKSYRNFVVGRRTIYYAHSEAGRDFIRVHDLGTGRDRAARRALETDRCRAEPFARRALPALLAGRRRRQRADARG